jgi:hypothetical protein
MYGIGEFTDGWTGEAQICFSGIRIFGLAGSQVFERFLVQYKFFQIALHLGSPYLPNGFGNTTHNRTMNREPAIRPT